MDGAVELHFSATPDGVRFPTPAPTPAVPVDLTPDSVTRWDSYENLMPDTDTEDIIGEYMTNFSITLIYVDDILLPIGMKSQEELEIPSSVLMAVTLL